MDFSDDFDDELDDNKDLDHLLNQVNQIDNIFTESFKPEASDLFHEEYGLNSNKNEKINFNESFGPKFRKDSSPNIRKTIENVIFDEGIDEEQNSFAMPIIKLNKRKITHKKEESEELKGFVKLETTNLIMENSHDESDVEDMTQEIEPLSQIRSKNQMVKSYFPKNTITTKSDKSFSGNNSKEWMRNQSEIKIDLLQSNIMNLKENLRSYIKSKKSTVKKDKKKLKLKKLKKKLLKFQEENEKLKSKLKSKEALEETIKALRSRLNSHSEFSMSSFNKSRNVNLNVTGDSENTFQDSTSTVKAMNYSFTNDDKETLESNQVDPKLEYNITLSKSGNFTKKNSEEFNEDLVKENVFIHDFNSTDEKNETLQKGLTLAKNDDLNEESNTKKSESSQKEKNSLVILDSKNLEEDSNFDSLPNESISEKNEGLNSEQSIGDKKKQKKKKRKRNRKKKKNDNQYAVQDKGIYDFAKRNSLVLKKYFEEQENNN
jgi:hypothetical protein